MVFNSAFEGLKYMSSKMSIQT